jgi:malate/lactate dehydrogenase
MIYYVSKESLVLSPFKIDTLKKISEEQARKYSKTVYVLNRMNPLKSRSKFCISDPSLIFLEKEGIDILQKPQEISYSIPEWIVERINSRAVTSININYPNWQENMKEIFPRKWKVNIAGLGDVGGTLLTGLRLLGGDYISKIGIYDRNPNKIKRWEMEANQILPSFSYTTPPEVEGIDYEKLFDCDMFVFCISVGIPPVGDEKKDVRMAQFEGNSRIIGEYAKKARKMGFKGVFAIVSDPVDLLCKQVLISSNTNENGVYDFNGLTPEQIRGYGLGVMHARATYYSREKNEYKHYITEGRAFGPHGEGLVIADSIENYNEEISLYLTERAKKANLDVRSTGFKPYIAPALSSGSLSIISTISGKWHYSSTFIGGVFMGANNRLLPSGVELERLNIPEKLFKRIKETYERLGNII